MHIFENFDNEGLKHIEKLELVTNHDIQALVQYLQGKVGKHLKKWVHYGLTSQDINSCAMVIMHRGFNIKILHQRY